MTWVVKGDMHYQQCYMHDPCIRGSHVVARVDDGTCFKCHRPCICARLVRMRGEAGHE